MDRLSRLADSLVEGMTPVALAAQQDPAECTQEAPQQMPGHRLGLGQSGDVAASQLAASSGAESLRSGEFRGCSQGSHGEAAMQAPSQQRRKERDSGARGSTRPESSFAVSVSASESAWQGSQAEDDWAEVRNHRLARNHSQHDSGLRLHAQKEQRFTLQNPPVIPASHLPSSVPASDAMTDSHADTASLVEHSLLPEHRKSVVPQSRSAAEASAVKPASRLNSGAAASSNRSRSRRLEQAKVPQHVHPAAPTATARPQLSGPLDREPSEQDVTVSEAGEMPQSAAGEKQPQHRQADGNAHAGKVASVTDAADYSDESAQAGGADVAEQEQREGLLSDSEGEFERSIAAARNLRPANVEHISNRWLPLSLLAQCRYLLVLILQCRLLLRKPCKLRDCCLCYQPCEANMNCPKHSLLSQLQYSLLLCRMSTTETGCLCLSTNDVLVTSKPTNLVTGTLIAIHPTISRPHDNIVTLLVCHARMGSQTDKQNFGLQGHGSNPSQSCPSVSQLQRSVYSQHCCNSW